MDRHELTALQTANYMEYNYRPPQTLVVYGDT